MDLTFIRSYYWKKQQKREQKNRFDLWHKIEKEKKNLISSFLFLLFLGF